MPDCPMTTPSSMVEMLGSIPELNVTVPMPRILKEVCRGLMPLFRFSDGTSWTRSSELPTSALTSSRLDSAVTAIGTSCRLDARLVAVTITSSSLGAASLATAPVALLPKRERQL